MKNELLKLVLEGKNNIEIAKLFNVHRTTVGKWLKKFDITNKSEKNINCALCEKEIINNKHNRKHCSSCVTKIRRYRIKAKAVLYKGGKCERCGFTGNISALQFHHVNPNEKEFALANNKHSTNWATIQKELDKCQLLCANCHSIEHSDYDKIERHINDII